MWSPAPREQKNLACACRDSLFWYIWGESPKSLDSGDYEPAPGKARLGFGLAGPLFLTLEHNVCVKWLGISICRQFDRCDLVGRG